MLHFGASDLDCGDGFFTRALARYLSLLAQEFVGNLAKVAKNATESRTFTVVADPAGTIYAVAARAPMDAFLLPGVNVHRGDDTPFFYRVYPQKYLLPVTVHVNVLWSNYPQIGERLAINVASPISEAFGDLGGKLPIYDFTQSPPAPVPARYLI